MQMLGKTLNSVKGFIRIGLLGLVFLCIVAGGVLYLNFRPETKTVINDVGPNILVVHYGFPMVAVQRVHFLDSGSDEYGIILPGAILNLAVLLFSIAIIGYLFSKLEFRRASGFRK